MSDKDFENLVTHLIGLEARILASIDDKLSQMKEEFMSDFSKLQAAEDSEGAQIAALTAKQDAVTALVADLNTKLAALQTASASGDQASIDALTAEVVAHGQNIQAELDKPMPTEAGSGASTVSGGGTVTVPGADSVGGLDTSNPSNDSITGANTVPAGSSTPDTTAGGSSS